MNSTCRPLLSTPLGGGGIRPLRAMIAENAGDQRLQQLVVQPLEHRPEHQHLLLAPLVDLARGDLAAVGLGHHQEQVGVERLLDAALDLGDVGGERAEVEAHVDRRPEALAVRIGDVGDAARQQARRLVLERGRSDHRRPDLLVDRLELAALLDLQLLGCRPAPPSPGRCPSCRSRPRPSAAPCRETRCSPRRAAAGSLPARCARTTPSATAGGRRGGLATSSAGPSADVGTNAAAFGLGSMAWTISYSRSSWPES